MGQLDLPESGLVCLDTSSVIYSVEKIEPFSSLLEPLWSHAGASMIRLTGSSLLLLECLVKPVRDGDREVEAIFRALLIGSAEFHLMPITTAVLERAVQLRAEFGLRTPDAIHAATALEVGCVQFVTNDVQFRRVTDLPVIVLGDYL